MIRIDNPRVKIDDIWKYIINDSSTWTLIFSNVLTIIIAVLQNWSLLFLLLIYWSQSVIIGFFNFVRILNLKEFSTKGYKIGGIPVAPTKGVKYFTAFFFAFHYGVFHLGYLAFLGVFSIFESPGALISNLIFVPIISLVFLINHLFSFLKNKESDLKKKRNIGHIMFFPYARIFPMHIIIIFGLFLGGAAIVLFLVLKTIADVVMHVMEHTI